MLSKRIWRINFCLPGKKKHLPFITSNTIANITCNFYALLNCRQIFLLTWVFFSRFCLYCLFRCCFSYVCFYVCFRWLSLGNLFIRKMETFLRPPSYYRPLCRQNSLQGIDTFTDFDIVSLMGWRHDICYWELQDKTVKGKIRSSKLLLF